MANWKDRIPGCFGAVDKIFAGHPNDQQRAREMLADAIAAGASMKDITDEARTFLEKAGGKADHVTRQLDEMRNLENYLGSGE